MNRSPARLALIIFSQLVLSFILGCSTAGHRAQTGAATPSNPAALTREAAALRATQIRGVAYNLWFGIDAEHPDFQGRVTIRFDRVGGAKGDIHLDFQGGVIESLTINGQAVPAALISKRYDGHKIRFTQSELETGANRIDVAYHHAYSKTGSGLIRYQDPTDNRFYLYTDFEPYDANQVFPCFDQPDLKATYELSVEAPAHWTVIGNTPEQDVTLQARRKTWLFPPSPAFSTYLFAMHAGEYRVWKGDANGIPLRLFARHSVAKYVNAPEWFQYTREGLAFYSTEFGYPYPYAKYDQIIVPEFNAGAMENVAAITFSERYIYRSRVTEEALIDRADTILHEMAHMWFGDLVTMRWWNGIWLNESFATFASSLALDNATEFGRRSSAGSRMSEDVGELKPIAESKAKVPVRREGPVWGSFFAGMKQWAYWEDQLVTTHPIEVSVPDTDQAFANFDGITYGKGASVLKQLRFLIGEDEFRDALQRYFHRFALRNTSIADFMHVMSEASGRDLSLWQRQWLQTPGVNGLAVSWECGPAPKTGKSVVRTLKLKQSSDAPHSTLRTHRTRLALYASSAASLSPYETIDTEYRGAETAVPAAVGKACPEFVFANHDDFDFVRLFLGEHDLGFIESHLSKFSDSLTRTMLWHTLGERMLLGELKPARFAAIAFKHLNHENNPKVLEQVIGLLMSMNESDNSVYRLLPVSDRPAFAEKLREFAIGGLRRSKAGTDAQLIWFNATRSGPLNDTGLKRVADWLKGKDLPAGIALDTGRRWELVRTLARMGAADSHAIIAAETDRDPTDLGFREAIRAEASIPDATVKREWFDRMISAGPLESSGERTYSESELGQAMRNFVEIGQEPLFKDLREEFYLALPKVATLKGDRFAAQFVTRVLPVFCSSESLKRAKTFLDTNGKILPPLTLKKFRIRIQEEERCLKSRQ